MRLDYYPFGSVMPGRNFSAPNGYRYGFNGMEKDDEVKGSGNSLDFGARIYDSRLARFLSIDPHSSRFAAISSYHFGANNPIINIDNKGENPLIFLYLIYKAEKWLAKATNASIYQGLSLEAKFGVAEIGGEGTTLAGGFAIDPKGNLAIVGSFGFFANFLGKGIQYGGKEGEYSSDFCTGADVGLDGEASYMWGQKHVKDFSGSSGQWLSVNGGPGSITLETSADGRETQGITVGAGPGEGASFSRIGTDSRVWAFTEGDLKTASKAATSALGKYAFLKLTGSYYNVNIKSSVSELKNNKGQIETTYSYIVSANNYNYNSDVKDTYTFEVIKFTQEDKYYSKTANVKDPK